MCVCVCVEHNLCLLHFLLLPGLPACALACPLTDSLVCCWRTSVCSCRVNKKARLEIKNWDEGCGLFRNQCSQIEFLLSTCYSKLFPFIQWRVCACLLCHPDPCAICFQVVSRYHGTGQVRCPPIPTLCNHGQQQYGVTPLCHCCWTTKEAAGGCCSEVRGERITGSCVVYLHSCYLRINMTTSMQSRWAGHTCISSFFLCNNLLTQIFYQNSQDLWVIIKTSHRSCFWKQNFVFILVAMTLPCPSYQSNSIRGLFEKCHSNRDMCSPSSTLGDVHALPDKMENSTHNIKSC